MCGIAGVITLDGGVAPGLGQSLAVMGRLIAHRGPDGEGTWESPRGDVGFAHRRLSIIDLSDHGAQPMIGEGGLVIVTNGEIYNYLELRDSLASRWRFTSTSDTETILAAYAHHGDDCVDHLRGMFAFALWDERKRRLFCARDRFGIKPFYYVQVGQVLYFASEIKALLPFVPDIETDSGALAEYFTFQYCIGEHTLFRGIKQLLPGHALAVENGRIRVWRYWDVRYDIDFGIKLDEASAQIAELVDDSIRVHLRSDVPVGSYLSGGIDSSLIAILAANHRGSLAGAFHGKFTSHPGYDESAYAQTVAEGIGVPLETIDITAGDFRDNISKVIYYLDQPVAGPGSFPQYMVSKLARERVKVVLGGQGGDEIFGGYARYLLAYFEQCIKAAIEGTYKDGNFIVTAESIIPNLGILQEYKPMVREFWREGLFGPLDERYFRLVDRSTDIQDEVDWTQLDKPRVFEDFKAIFNRDNVQKEAYFDKMTHFDFKCLLPALLLVEDRMSMAHGLESRVPFLDHRLVEYVATIPADVKFKDGNMKHLLKKTFSGQVPDRILNRRDKMGFPVPLREWLSGDLEDMVTDIFSSDKARSRPYVNTRAVLANLKEGQRYSRRLWGLLSLELWQRLFHDRAEDYRRLTREAPIDRPPSPEVAVAAGDLTL